MNNKKILKNFKNMEFFNFDGQLRPLSRIGVANDVVINACQAVLL